jgi:hypothetical protein
MIRMPRIKTVTGPPGSASATTGLLIALAAISKPRETTQKIPVFLQSFLTLIASGSDLVSSPSNELRIGFNKYLHHLKDDRRIVYVFSLTYPF